ncbi:MAG: hypothetical protein GF404_07845 [candidate division Zixibacteria bacterium]|nr:hypothetical protein [candidate division Zixibacteria bacterium]
MTETIAEPVISTESRSLIGAREEKSQLLDDSTAGHNIPTNVDNSGSAITTPAIPISIQTKKVVKPGPV